MLVKILTFLSGKKSTILGIILTTVAFLVTKGFVDADTSAYIGAIMTIIFGTASYATTKLVYPTK